MLRGAANFLGIISAKFQYFGVKQVFAGYSTPVIVVNSFLKYIQKHEWGWNGVIIHRIGTKMTKIGQY